MTAKVKSLKKIAAKYQFPLLNRCTAYDAAGRFLFGSTCTIRRNENSSSGSEEQPSEEELPVIGPPLGSDVRLWRHGREWKLKTSLEVDPAVDHQPKRTTIHWPQLALPGAKQPSQYFLLFFSISHMLTAQDQTNAALSSKVRTGNQGPVSAGELLRWLGIRLAMAVEPKRGDLKTYWLDKDTEGSVYTASNYNSRFKMSRHRFEFITQKIRFNNIPTAAESEMVSYSSSFPSMTAFFTGSLA